MTPPDPPTVFSVTIRASQQAVRSVLGDLRQRVAAAGLGDDLCGTVEIVLAEVLNNIVEHAYADRPGGTVRISVAHAPDHLAFDLRDRGRALPGLALPRGDLPRHDRPLVDLPEGGFGWFLIHRLTSALRYDRTGSQNRLTFRIATNPAP